MTTRNPTPPPDDDALNEFAGLPAEAVAAFVFKDGGEAALRQAFELADEAEPHNREDLDQIAKALEARGLNAPATVLHEIAADVPSGIEFNPYQEGSTNWQCWRKNWIRRRRQATGELEADLRRRKAGNNKKRGNSQH